MKNTGTTMLALLLCGACRGETPRTEDVTLDSAAVAVPSDTAGMADTTPAPAAEPALRLFASVPDSAKLRRGACPFECCIYREWQAETSIPVRARPDPRADHVFDIAAGTRFSADSGHVRVTGASIIVVQDTVFRDPDRQAQFVRGDTVVLLDYVGEGYWNVWHRGRVIREVGTFWGRGVGTPRGVQHGDYRSEWWVHATTPERRSGWFHADTTIRIKGADACG